jgi:DNA processing protein
VGGVSAPRPSRALGERDAWIALAHCVEPADAAVGRLLAAGGPEDLLDRIRRGATGLRQGPGLAARLAGYDSDRALDGADASGARIVTRADAEWPTQLDDLGAQAPLALWVAGAGSLRLLALRSVAVVGARACTPYGEHVAHEWSAHLADAGWTVISGAAFGIDAAAHRGALAAGGTTVAVVAGGIDVPYPRAHQALLARIADDGLVVSESPPGEQVRRQRFLSRNRLIAALARVTVVVEAAHRSGTTATARSAAAMNRVVLAVPGSVQSPASAGCHRLVREGLALIAGDVADVLGALDLGSMGVPASPPAPPVDPRDGLADRERTVLDAIPGRGVIDLERLVRSAGLGPADVLAGASVLAARGLLEEVDGGWRLSRPAVGQRA